MVTLATVDTRDGEAIFATLAPEGMLPADRLGDLVVHPGTTSSFGSGLQERAEAALRSPMCELTCGQVRMLVGQRIGLKWLARPVALFVAAYPLAECDLYPGDMSVNALRALDDFMIHAYDETRQMLAADFSELQAEPMDALLSDALGSLASARSALGIGQSGA